MILIEGFSVTIAVVFALMKELPCVHYADTHSVHPNLFKMFDATYCRKVVWNANQVQIYAVGKLIVDKNGEKVEGKNKFSFPKCLAKYLRSICENINRMMLVSLADKKKQSGHLSKFIFHVLCRTLVI